MEMLFGQIVGLALAHAVGLCVGYRCSWHDRLTTTLKTTRESSLYIRSGWDTKYVLPGLPIEEVLVVAHVCV